MKKQLKAISACLLSALLATTALPFSKVEARSKWVEINGVNYEINRMTGECEASLNVTQGKSEVTIPNKVSYQGDTYKVTFLAGMTGSRTGRKRQVVHINQQLVLIRPYLKRLPLQKAFVFLNRHVTIRSLKQLFLKTRQEFPEQNFTIVHSFRASTFLKK